MKTKIVLKGHKTTGDNEKQPVFLAMELQAEQNKVLSRIFEGAVVTDELYTELMEKWRKGDEVLAFPDHHQTTQELSAQSELKPEGIELEQADLLSRTKTEWMLIVLSAKLFNVFKSELAELQDRIDALKEYDKTLWEEMKTFWDKVQTSQTEKHISREHANMLRDQTNELFAQLKKLRSAEDEVFEAEAKNNFERLDQELQRIKNAFASAHPELNNLFNALKELQREFRNARLTRGMRTQLWEGIDQAFKDIKEKRFPSNAAAPSHNANNDTRLQRRIEGLKEAVQRMEESIQRDDKELQIQNQKMDSSTANQLEVQLREVRAKLIRERIESKNTKLSDMKKTLHDLEEKLKKAAAKQQPPQEEKNAANEEPQD